MHEHHRHLLIRYQFDARRNPVRHGLIGGAVCAVATGVFTTPVHLDVLAGLEHLLRYLAPAQGGWPVVLLATLIWLGFVAVVAVTAGWLFTWVLRNTPSVNAVTEDVERLCDAQRLLAAGVPGADPETNRVARELGRLSTWVSPQLYKAGILLVGLLLLGLMAVQAVAGLVVSGTVDVNAGLLFALCYLVLPAPFAVRRLNRIREFLDRTEPDREVTR